MSHLNGKFAWKIMKVLPILLPVQQILLTALIITLCDCLGNHRSTPDNGVIPKNAVIADANVFA